MILRKNILIFVLVHSNPCNIKDIFNINSCYICRMPASQNTSETYNDIKFCKEAKTIKVVDMWLNTLRLQSGTQFNIYISRRTCLGAREKCLPLKRWWPQVVSIIGQAFLQDRRSVLIFAAEITNILEMRLPFNSVSQEFVTFYKE